MTTGGVRAGECTNCYSTVIHPEGLLHVRAQQDFPITDGAAVQVPLDANGSALIGIPIKLVWSDLRSLCHDNKDVSIYKVSTHTHIIVKCLFGQTWYFLTVKRGTPQTLEPLGQVGFVLRLQDQRLERRST